MFVRENHTSPGTGSGTASCPKCGGMMFWKINDYGGFRWCNECPYTSEF